MYRRTKKTAGNTIGHRGRALQAGHWEIDTAWTNTDRLQDMGDSRGSRYIEDREKIKS